ncbi:MAG: hypothetical protein LBH81_03130 [Rickettsiales bacterium]|jgi:hypothetical protein|nr:hypothetical protein [Rickettsiales bacterium]
MYGSNGHDKKPEGLVIENFKTRAAENNFKLPGEMHKSIVKPRFVLAPKPHRQIIFGGGGLAFYHGPISGWPLRCNHYHCKSWEEYQKRMARGSGVCGMGQGGVPKYNREFFENCDHNDVLDPIMDEYIPPLKKRLT